MKKHLTRLLFIMAVISCSAIPSATFAQQFKRTPEAKAKKMTDSMKTNLALTDSQYAKAYTVNLDYATKMQDLRSKAGSKADKMQAVKHLHKSHRQDINAVLTKDQVQRLKAMHKKEHLQRRNETTQP